jgi:D-cysteine desulfhydrase
MRLSNDSMANLDLSGIARERLALLPTPLQPAPRLSAAIGVEVWFKRDDLTGLGLGGNKVRPLEFLLGEALARHCDVLVTGSGAQSNWSMLAALAARRCGLDSVVCFYGTQPPEARGNLLLQGFTGADLRWTGDASRASVDLMIEQVADELRSAGRTPLVVPRGGATARGSLGYLAAAAEIADQAADAGLINPTLWLGTGSCGTQGGLVAGVAAGFIPRVVGVTVSRPADECRERVFDLARGAADLARTPAPDATMVTVIDGFIGPGYGYASHDGAAAADLVARTEGIFLDPPFCAKAMAALMSSARAGEIDSPVILLVSGGGPTLFVQDGPL